MKNESRMKKYLFHIPQDLLDTLKNLSYGNSERFNISLFIREAIREKLKRDYNDGSKKLLK